MKRIHLFLYKYRVLMGVLPVAIGILFFVMDENSRFNKTMLGIGSIIMLIGTILRIWTAMYNWENINSIEPIATNGIITNGPYRYCRNPMYLSAIILTLGFSLIFDSWQVVAIAVLPTIGVHLHQIYVEERFLINICNDFYETYKKKVPRLIPFRGKVVDISAQGKANWKRGLQRDAGPIFGGIVFIFLIFALMPFLKYDYMFLLITFVITVVLNFVIVGKIKSDAAKVKLIPSTAPAHVLLQPLRYILFPITGYMEKLKMNTTSENYVVLDLGCGPGYHSIPLAKKINGTLIAFDIRDKMIKITRQRAEKKKIHNIKYVQGDSAAIALPDNSVDLICINLVLGEIVKLEESLDEFLRILKATGEISIMESIFDDHYMNADEVTLLFKKKNFILDIVDRKKTYYILNAKINKNATKGVKHEAKI